MIIQTKAVNTPSQVKLLYQNKDLLPPRPSLSLPPRPSLSCCRNKDSVYRSRSIGRLMQVLVLRRRHKTPRCAIVTALQSTVLLGGLQVWVIWSYWNWQQTQSLIKDTSVMLIGFRSAKPAYLVGISTLWGTGLVSEGVITETFGGMLANRKRFVWGRGGGENDVDNDCFVENGPKYILNQPKNKNLYSVISIWVYFHLIA